MTNNIIERGYNGNVNLKRKGVSVEFSQEMVGEFIKCAQNPVYFAEKYIQIVHVDHGLIPISLYDYQKEIVDKITNNRRVTVVTSRQAGKTTTAVAVILHYIIFNEHRTLRYSQTKVMRLVKYLIESRLHTKHCQSGYSRVLWNGTKVLLNLRMDVRLLLAQLHRVRFVVNRFRSCILMRLLS